MACSLDIQLNIMDFNQKWQMGAPRMCELL